MLQSDQNRERYLNLLKKSLINFFYIDCEYSHYANAMPLEWVLPEPEDKDLSIKQRTILKLKFFCRSLLIWVFGKFGLLKWDRIEKDYYPVHIDIHQKGG